MKRNTLLHAELSGLIATLGHGDMLVLGDAGLPIPDGPRRIDLALRPGVPRIGDVLEAVLSEMQIERALLAREALLSLPPGKLPDWCTSRLPVQPELIAHDGLKRLCDRARAVVRTGEFTPYANIVLVAGVCF